MKMKQIYYQFFLLLGSIFFFNIVKGLIPEKIIDGEDAQAEQLEYTVGVMYSPNEPNVDPVNTCSGVIIDSWHISTVAHCFYDEAGNIINKEFYIVFAMADLYNPVFPSFYKRIQFVIMPLIFNPIGENNHTKTGNVAVVKLVSPVKFGAGTHLRYLTLPQRPKDGNRIYTISGYGCNTIVHTITVDFNGTSTDISYGLSDGKMRMAKAYILELSDCYRAIGFDMVQHYMCVQILQGPNERKGICTGDSGAPLVRGRYIVGLAINGFQECNENKKPAFYVDVFSYLSFINAAKAGNYNNMMRIYELKETTDHNFQFVPVPV